VAIARHWDVRLKPVRCQPARLCGGLGHVQDTSARVPRRTRFRSSWTCPIPPGILRLGWHRGRVSPGEVRRRLQPKGCVARDHQLRRKPGTRDAVWKHSVRTAATQPDARSPGGSHVVSFRKRSISCFVTRWWRSAREVFRRPRAISRRTLFSQTPSIWAVSRMLKASRETVLG